VALLAIAFLGSLGAGSGAGGRRAEARIAFACSGDICVTGAAGRGARRLTRDRKLIDSYPAWSRDGRRIAFTVNLGTRTVVDVMNADGSGRERLTRGSADEAMPAWSPDGTTLALDDNASGRIDLVSPEGDGRRPLVLRRASLPAWSPTGHEIAFVSGDGRKLALTSGDIYVVGADGSDPRLLTRNGTFPAWSPDGRTIAFLRNTRRWSEQVDVWVMNPDGSGKRRVWSHAAEGGGLSWSPDGTALALTSQDHIYVIATDGTKPRQLTRGWTMGLDPSWQPTG
jgi:TolB protein